MAVRLPAGQPADATVALANLSRNGCASPAPPGYPGAQNTSVATAAISSVLIPVGYHSRALRAYCIGKRARFTHEHASLAQATSNLPPGIASAVLDRRRILDPGRGP